MLLFDTVRHLLLSLSFFFFNDTATTEIYTLSLHDALPISSISINGVSLTISKVIKNYLVLNVIPHTLKLTNLKNLKTKSLVNVELDIFSKYIHKYSN